MSATWGTGASAWAAPSSTGSPRSLACGARCRLWQWRLHRNAGRALRARPGARNRSLRAAAGVRPHAAGAAIAQFIPADAMDLPFPRLTASMPRSCRWSFSSCPIRPRASPRWPAWSVPAGRCRPMRGTWMPEVFPTRGCVWQCAIWASRFRHPRARRVTRGGAAGSVGAGRSGGNRNAARLPSSGSTPILKNTGRSSSAARASGASSPPRRPRPSHDCGCCWRSD